ncbi:hypothetical protein JCM10908_004749 [Rhodotorula pacifica]|uniref:uncharacterized protein n=1 Tax=Rhodotorula pacifica TaxID=1495444 RepID=UPI0031766567
MTWDGNLQISALHSAYASGTVTPAQVVETVLRRVGEYAQKDPAVWIDVVPLEDALARAQELEKQYEGQEKPRLYGVPFSVKNSIDLAGFKTTVACPSFAYMAKETAPVVQRCLDEGAILIGTTNLEQFATGLTGHRSPYGTPRSVFDSEYTSGGSSSGSAVSVGAKLVSFSIGSDTAGSIRLPAVYNGLVGMKPTMYSVSTRGVVPASKTADCVSVLAATVDDARTALEVIRWYDEEDTLARPYSVFDILPAWPEKIRFGVPPKELVAKLSEPYARAWEQVVSRLQTSETGLSEVSYDYSPFQDANAIMYGSSFVAQRLASFDDYLKEHGTSKLHPAVAAIFDKSKGFSAVQAFQDQFKLLGYKRRVDREFREHLDVLIVPTTVRHWKVEEVDVDPLGRNIQLGEFTQFANLVDLCAIAIPVGGWTNEKGRAMPFGITLLAPAGRDEDLMQLAERLLPLLPEAAIRSSG